MSEIHKSYEDEAKESPDYDEDGYNNYLDYQYIQYPFGEKEVKDED